MYQSLNNLSAEDRYGRTLSRSQHCQQIWGGQAAQFSSTECSQSVFADLCHSPLPLTQIHFHFWLQGVEHLQVLVFKVLPCFTSSEAMESPTSKSDIIRLLMNLKYSSLRAFIRVTSVKIGSSSLEGT